MSSPGESDDVIGAGMILGIMGALLLAPAIIPVVLLWDHIRPSTKLIASVPTVIAAALAIWIVPGLVPTENAYETLIEIFAIGVVASSVFCVISLMRDWPAIRRSLNTQPDTESVLSEEKTDEGSAPLENAKGFAGYQATDEEFDFRTQTKPKALPKKEALLQIPYQR